jgi:hypothetical protein
VPVLRKHDTALRFTDAMSAGALMDPATGDRQSAALTAAVELGVFDALSAGPATDTSVRPGDPLRALHFPARVTERRPGRGAGSDGSAD